MKTFKCNYHFSIQDDEKEWAFQVMTNIPWNYPKTLLIDIVEGITTALDVGPSETKISNEGHQYQPGGKGKIYLRNDLFCSMTEGFDFDIKTGLLKHWENEEYCHQVYVP